MSDNQTPATQADSAIDNATEHTTHFGFKQVDKGQKASLVANVFDSVAAKQGYDLVLNAGAVAFAKEEHDLSEQVLQQVSKTN
jgi:Skp family chaperone for outer membrane proteins